MLGNFNKLYACIGRFELFLLLFPRLDLKNFHGVFVQSIIDSYLWRFVAIFLLIILKLNVYLWQLKTCYISVTVSPVFQVAVP